MNKFRHVVEVPDVRATPPAAAHVAAALRRDLPNPSGDAQELGARTGGAGHTGGCLSVGDLSASRPRSRKPSNTAEVIKPYYPRRF